MVQSATAKILASILVKIFTRVLYDAIRRSSWCLDSVVLFA